MNDQVKSNSKSFKLYIVSNALDKKKQLIDVFYSKGKDWINDVNKLVIFYTATSARNSQKNKNIHYVKTI